MKGFIGTLYFWTVGEMCVLIHGIWPMQGVKVGDLGAGCMGTP